MSLKKSFAYANAGPLIARQLGHEEGYRQAFDSGIAALIKKAQKKDRNLPPAEVTAVMEAFVEKVGYPGVKERPLILQWMCLQYLAHRHNGKPILSEDLYKLGEDIAYFESVKKSPVFQNTGVSADLLTYTYAALQETLKPFEEQKRRKEAEAGERRLTPEEKKIIAEETTVIYDGPEGRVVVPHPGASSRYWSCNTNWCISGEEYAETHFPNYNAKSPGNDDPAEAREKREGRAGGQDFLEQRG